MNNFKNSRKVPDYVKRILKYDVRNRTKDDINIAAKFLNFDDYPYEKQIAIAKVGLFEEYEPQRIILRQNKYQRNFYFIIQGMCVTTKKVASFDFVLDTLVEFLHTGDRFGDRELIYKSQRTTTITATGHQNVCLLSIHEDDFFKIFEPIDEISMKLDFLRNNVPLLNSIDFPFEDIIKPTDQSAHATAFFKNGKLFFFVSFIQIIILNFKNFKNLKKE